MRSSRRPQNGAGVGLRLPHIAEVAVTRPPAALLEVHPENFLANPHATELLVDLAHYYPISVHSVGVSIGSASGVDRAHFARVRALVDLIDPILVSGHLAWSSHAGEYLNDLLPLPYDRETLRLVARHVDEVQNGLGRVYLVENPASYVGFGSSAMSETEFLCELVRLTGCQLLCDISNAYLSANNLEFDPYGYIDSLPVDAIGEFHLGGFTIEEDEGDPSFALLIDTHAAPIAEPVWNLYAHAVRRFGPKPTLVEWDNSLPPFSTILSEARQADAVIARVFPPEARSAVAR